jgi:hypothetical protein
MTGRAQEVAPETVMPVELIRRGTVAPPRG